MINNNRPCSPIYRFKQIKDKKERLKKLAKSDEFQNYVGFIYYKDKIPFSNDILPNIKENMKLWKDNAHPEVFWEEFYLKTRNYLAEQKERYSNWVKAHENRIILKPESPKHLLVQLVLQIKTSKIAKKHGIIFKKDVTGCGDALFCFKNKEFSAVIKSISGDPGSIDNPSMVCHPLQKSHTRPVNSYQSSIKEAFSYELSRVLKVPDTIPPTILTIIENDQFHSFFNNHSVKAFLSEFPEYKKDLYERLGKPSNKRLCSVQQVIKNACTLEEFERNLKGIDQTSFEDVIYLTRVLWETDGHMKNFLVKELDGKNHLYKIDSGFSFPLNNSHAQNSLILLKNAAMPISWHYKKLILDTDCKKIKDLANKFFLQKKCIEAAVKRIDFMKKLVKAYPEINHREFELRLRMFGGFKFNAETRFKMNIFKGKITSADRERYALSEFTKKELSDLESLKLYGITKLTPTEGVFDGNFDERGYAVYSDDSM